MFKRTGVARRNLVGKDGGSGCEVKGVYKKKMVLREKEGRDTNIIKKKVTIRTLREESEQCIIGLFG